MLFMMNDQLIERQIYMIPIQTLLLQSGAIKMSSSGRAVYIYQ